MTSVNDDNLPPPMPAKWLDAVTKAVLGSSESGTRVGGPPNARASGSRRTGRTSGRNRIDGLIPPHTMTSYLQRGQTAPNAVTTVRVTCRSAPASRSSSRIGDRTPFPFNISINTKLQQQQQQQSKRKLPRKSKGDRMDCVPSLANIKLENDAWSMQWVDGKRVSTVSTGSDYEDDEEDEDDEEEEDEIDLARLLVPPKRQHSIRSLRRHLHRSDSTRVLRGVGKVGSSRGGLDPWNIEDELDQDRQSWRGSVRDRERDGRGRRGSNVEDGYGSEHGREMFGDVSGGVKRRRGGIPGPWSGRS